MAVIDVAGFVADLKDHAVDHGFHVHDERHFVETYSLRQAWEVDLHPEDACGGPLDLHLALEIDPSVLLSFEDLVLILEDVPEITFTGDARLARALDRHANRRAWLAKAWDASLTMIEYVRAVDAGYEGLFAQWCDGDAPPGARTLPVGSSKALVPSEGEQVKGNRSMAAERLLPVPTSVDPSGHKHMWSHIRLGGGGDTPRMHYLESGPQVYIGHIGRHLTNTLT